MAINIKNINKRIKNIKSTGITPSTVKSVASAYSDILFPKGASREGEIKSFTQAKKDYDVRLAKGEIPFPVEFTPEHYESQISELLENPNIQTTVKSAIDYSYDTAIKNLSYLGDVDPELYDFIKSQSKSDVLELIIGASEANKSAMREGYASGSGFMTYLEGWLDDKGFYIY